MNVSRLRVVVIPHWVVLDASVTVSLDGKPLGECGLTEGAEIGPLEIDPGAHEVSALLVGIVRRAAALSVTVGAGEDVRVEVDYSRLTGALSLRATPEPAECLPQADSPV